MASPAYSPGYSPSYSTNERTNELTKKVLGWERNMTLSYARARKPSKIAAKGLGAP